MDGAIGCVIGGGAGLDEVCQCVGNEVFREGTVGIYCIGIGMIVVEEVGW